MRDPHPTSETSSGQFWRRQYRQAARTPDVEYALDCLSWWIEQEEDHRVWVESLTERA
jgi:rubrerythrin